MMKITEDITSFFISKYMAFKTEVYWRCQPVEEQEERNAVRVRLVWGNWLAPSWSSLRTGGSGFTCRRFLAGFLAGTEILSLPRPPGTQCLLTGAPLSPALHVPGAWKAPATGRTRTEAFMHTCVWVSCAQVKSSNTLNTAFNLHSYSVR